jgi:hypothetical protein
MIFPFSFANYLLIWVLRKALVLQRLQIICSIRCEDGIESCGCPIGNADKNGSKRVGWIRMRTKQPKNRSYIKVPKFGNFGSDLRQHTAVSCFTAQDRSEHMIDVQFCQLVPSSSAHSLHGVQN